MTRTSNLRIVLTVVVALALLLGGFSYFGTEAKAEGEAADYSGEYYIAFQNSSGQWWYMTGSVNNKAYVVNNSGLSTLPESVDGAEAIEECVFVIERFNSENNTYKIRAKYTQGNNYLALSKSTTTDVTLKDFEGGTCLILTETASGLFKMQCEGTTRYLAMTTTESPAIKWYSNPGSSYISNFELIPVISDEPECTHTNTELVGAKDATCEEEGHTGTTRCTDCQSITDSGSVIPALGHSYIGGVCSECGKTDPNSVDYSGTYVFAAKRTNDINYQFISSIITGSSTKRYALVDSGSADAPTDAILRSEDAMDIIFTVVKCENGKYKIYAEGVDAEEKYLGWKSGNSGILVSESDARELDITKTEDGTYNITFSNGSETRYLSMNSTATNLYAAWYTGTQLNDLYFVPVTDCKITGAQVNAGANLTVKYYAEFADGFLADGDVLTMKFTMNGEEIVASGSSVNANKYVFAISGIAPHQMGDLIDAELVLTRGGASQIIDEKNGYSVEKNLISLLSKELAKGDDASEELVNLINDTLAYGAAAQIYKNYKIDDIIGAEAALVPTTISPSADDEMIYEGEKSYIKGAGVIFDDVITLYFILENIDGVRVTLNGSVVEPQDMGDGTYRIFVRGLSATEFDNRYVIVAGETTLSYSVNSYAYSKESSDDENMRNLALALYRYGVSAEEYVGAAN